MPNELSDCVFYAPDDQEYLMGGRFATMSPCKERMDGICSTFHAEAMWRALTAVCTHRQTSKITQRDGREIDCLHQKLIQIHVARRYA